MSIARCNHAVSLDSCWFLMLLYPGFVKSISDWLVATCRYYITKELGFTETKGTLGSVNTHATPIQRRRTFFRRYLCVNSSGGTIKMLWIYPNTKYRLITDSTILSVRKCKPRYFYINIAALTIFSFSTGLSFIFHSKSRIIDFILKLREIKPLPTVRLHV